MDIDFNVIEKIFLAGYNILQMDNILFFRWITFLFPCNDNKLAGNPFNVSDNYMLFKSNFYKH